MARPVTRGKRKAPLSGRDREPDAIPGYLPIRLCGGCRDYPKGATRHLCGQARGGVVGVRALACGEWRKRRG